MEVSILVSPENQGQGIGRSAVTYIGALAPDRPKIAYVHPGHAASLALFRSCGYGQRDDLRLRLLDQTYRIANHARN